MSLRFPINSESVEIRGQRFTVRELTYKQKKLWAKAVQADMYCAPYVLAAMVCDVSEEVAEDWPAQVLEEVADIARRISGMAGKEGAEKND